MNRVHRGGAGARIGNPDCAGVGKALPNAFVVGEDEGVVLVDGSAAGCAELDAAERRNLWTVEVIARIEDAVAIEQVRGSVKLVGTGLGNGRLMSAPDVRPYSAV